MLKKTLLAATSLAVLGGVAYAGELKVRLDNVNVFDPNPSDDVTPSEDGTLHIDFDNFSPDFNGNDGPDNEASPGNVSVDKPFRAAKACKTSALEFCHVILADERFVDPEHPLQAHFEVDVFELDGDSTFTGDLGFTITLLDSPANAVWKENGNCSDFVRAGSDNLESLSAATFANTGGPGGSELSGFVAGESQAFCQVTPELGGNGLLAESAVGWVLPIETTGCGDIIVRMDVVRASLLGNRTETTTHTIATCEPSIKVDISGIATKVDYYTGFKSFLITEEAGKFDDHIPSDRAHIGKVDIDLHHFLVDLKDETKSNDSIFDASDFDADSAWTFVLQFTSSGPGGDALTGIEFVRLVGGATVEADLDYVNDTATFTLSRDELISVFGFDENRDGTYKGDTDEGEDAYIEIEAFDPDAPKFIFVPGDKTNPDGFVPTGAGAIDHQEISVAVNDFLLFPRKEPGTPFAKDDVKFGPGPFRKATGFLSEIDKTGMNFGAFDWVGDMISAANMTNNVFRVSHFPEIDQHENDIDRVKGQVELKGSTNGACDGEYKFDFDRASAFGGRPVSNGEIIITSGDVTALVDAANPAGCEDGAFNRSDISFTFFVNQIDMDMDRLMLRNGIVSGYGDNSNDANSIKARSCDDGRFGPHVANKLTAEAQDDLLGEDGSVFGSCSFGEVDRSGLDD